jgi:hypothetical protein
MSVSYDGNIISPAPLVTINKSYINAGDGTPINVNYDITITGTLLPGRGSPNSSGTFSTGTPLADETFTTDAENFNSLLVKQQALRELFRLEGKAFEWIPPGYSEVKCYPQIVSINFPQGQWVQRSDYTVTLRANRLYGPSGDQLESLDKGVQPYNLRNANDSWSVQENEENDDVLTITHTVSATAFTRFDDENEFDIPNLDEAWEWAKTWVKTRITTVADTMHSTNEQNFLENKSIFGITFGSGAGEYQAYSRKRVENLDRFSGTYSITDTWTLSTNGVVETYSVKHSSSNADVTTGGAKSLGFRNQFSITGSIRGLDSSTTTKYEAAENFFNNNILDPDEDEYILTRIKTDIWGDPSPNGVTIPSTPTSSSVTRDKVKGMIAYDYTFDDTPQGRLADVELVNVGKYDISISEEGGPASTPSLFKPTVLAVIPIPGRAKGPIIQDINTRPVLQRTITCQIFFKKSSGIYDANTFLGGRNEGRIVFNHLVQNESLKPDDDATLSGSYWAVTGFSDNYSFQDGVYNGTLTYTMRQ